MLCFTKKGEMRLISFDIGIKNMAYCIFNVPADDANNSVSIVSWDVLNLLLAENAATIEKHACTEKSKTKNKKTGIQEVCGSLAKYTKHTDATTIAAAATTTAYYCMKHAKTCGYIMPTKNTTEAGLKKKKVDDLQKLAAAHFISFPDGCLKKDMIQCMVAFYDKNALKPIVEVKSKGAGEVDLICIGRNMKRMLDQIPNIEDITHVIIENQISPIANRMKTLQGMLTQYFIMRGRPDIVIEFISSSNKLKGFSTPEDKDKTGAKGDANKKSEYKKHKIDGISICRQFLDANPEWETWKTHFHGFASKKDDLADSFLQGIWYLKNRKLINYAENLKINSVFLT